MKLLYKPSSTTHIFLRRIWDILEILEIILKKETIYNPFFSPTCLSQDALHQRVSLTELQTLDTNLLSSFPSPFFFAVLFSWSKAYLML